MIAALRRTFDSFRGAGDHALSIPSLDGAFRPNQAVEEAEALAALPAPDNLAVAGKTIFLTGGGILMRLGADGRAEAVEPDGAQSGGITALAGAPDGRLAIARGRRVETLAADGSRRTLAFTAPGDITALCFTADGGLALTVGAEGRRAADWRQDFMERGQGGSVWTLADGAPARQIAGGLAWPCGITAGGKGGFAVSTAWTAEVIRLGSDGQKGPLLSNLPGYPSRIISDPGGGYWLAVFAPRNQLVEFVLREPVYRSRMMAEVAPEYWVAPALAPADSPLEVMQDGAQKIGGTIKPWAPSLSYGMIVRLDPGFQPLFSLHSRANGRRHGITSLAVQDGRLLAASQGSHEIIRFAPGQEE